MLIKVNADPLVRLNQITVGALKRYPVCVDGEPDIACGG
jgi:hypothetical protein